MDIVEELKQIQSTLPSQAFHADFAINDLINKIQSAQTTRQAFKELIYTRSFYKEINMKKQTAASLRRSFESNTITIDKMEEVLSLAGYKPIQEKLWMNNKNQ